MASFLGLEDLTEEEVETISEATTFEAMRKNPLTNYSHWDTWGLRAPGKGRATEFYRKGRREGFTFCYCISLLSFVAITP